MCETDDNNLTFTTVEQKIGLEYLNLTFTTVEQKIAWEYLEAYLRYSDFA